MNQVTHAHWWEGKRLPEPRCPAACPPAGRQVAWGPVAVPIGAPAGAAQRAGKGKGTPGADAAPGLQGASTFKPGQGAGPTLLWDLTACGKHSLLPSTSSRTVPQKLRFASISSCFLMEHVLFSLFLCEMHVTAESAEFPFFKKGSPV